MSTFFDVDDDEQEKEQAKKAKLLREEELKDLREILDRKAGRRILFRYLEECSVFDRGFIKDPNQLYFLDGQKNIGLMILADIDEADPSALARMKEESKGELDA